MVERKTFVMHSLYRNGKEVDVTCSDQQNRQ